ncbi:hypothetical protein, partial [Klebsiella pneumoniae]|uniref:hypothetical protein n=1 Tax=Klebsiella pneumoniae TaxID=573 RepID=UPI001C3DA0DC
FFFFWVFLFFFFVGWGCFLVLVGFGVGLLWVFGGVFGVLFFVGVCVWCGFCVVVLAGCFFVGVGVVGV